MIISKQFEVISKQFGITSKNIRKNSKIFEFSFNSRGQGSQFFESCFSGYLDSSILSKRKLESKLGKQTDFLIIFED